MVSQNIDLESRIGSVYNAMPDCDGMIEYRALLRDVVDLRAFLINQIRWSKKYVMQERVWVLRDSLIRVADASDGKISLYRSVVFKLRF